MVYGSPMITGAQCRMARAGLQISNAELASASGVGVNTISRFEKGGDARASSIEAIQSALEARGASFLAAGQVSLSGGPGVRLD